ALRVPYFSCGADIGLDVCGSWCVQQASRAACESNGVLGAHFARQTLRLPRLAQKNETMGTRGTHGTNYFSQGINELQRRSPRLNVSRGTFSQVPSITSVATGSSTHNLTFSYDRYGNMTCVVDQQTNGLCSNYTFNASTNQISNSGYTYDAAGNLTADGSGTGSHTYQWDAENRLISIDSG